MNILRNITIIALSLLLVIALGADRARAADEEDKTAVEEKAKKPLTPWGQSYQLEAEKKYEKAIKAIKPYLKIKDDIELANMRVAWLEYLQGNYNDAINGYEKALSINPKSIDAKLGLTLPLMAQKRYREVRSHLNKLLKTSPWNYAAHKRLLVIDEIQGKWKHMTKHAKALSKRYPNDTTALVYLARGYAWQDNKTMAISSYTRVLLRIPGHLEALAYINKHKE
ncbi:MAG: tetratricopeptide repeat protein [Magnetococcales bacterium]|nr:tetratricopeptide repeat protein [Magnetococcales bacterium]